MPHYFFAGIFLTLLHGSLFSQLKESAKSGKYTVTEHCKLYSHSSPVELTIKTICTGFEAENIINAISSKGQDSLAKKYLKYYSEVYQGISVIKPLSIRFKSDSSEVILTEHYSIPEFFKKDSVSGAYDAGIFSDVVNGILPKLEPSIKKPLNVGWYNVDHTIQLDMPGGWNIDRESQEIKNSAFAFNYSIHELENVLTLHFQFKYLKDIIAIEDYKEFASQIRTIKDNYLNYPISHFPDSLTFYPNRGLLIFCACLVLIFAFIAYLIYYKVNPPAVYRGEAIPIGGWLIIVVLGLLGTIYNQIKTIIDHKHLDLNTWDFYSARQSSTFFKIILGTKVFAEIYIICFAFYCLFLIHKQRDILPKVITFYFATSAILMTIIHVLVTRFYGDHPDSITDLSLLLVSSFIGMYYFKTADRVKETFVVRAKKTGAKFS